MFVLYGDNFNSYLSSLVVCFQFNYRLRTQIKMTSIEESEATPAEEVPAGNPDEISKNPTALKGIQVLMYINGFVWSECLLRY